MTASSPVETEHKQKPSPGRTVKGSPFEAGRLPAPDALLPPPKRRPPHGRYPVDLETFLALKEKAATANPAKPHTTLTADESKGSGEATTATSAVLEAGAPLVTATVTAAAPTLLSSFPGIHEMGGMAPPDCALAAGPSHLLVSVNSSVAIYGKMGGAALKLATLRAWFQNVISGAFIFDPSVLYDQHAGRWVVLAAATGPGTRASWFLLSVSQTSNPLGGWWNYRLNAKKVGTVQTGFWADYPRLGVDNQALYITANMFNFDEENPTFMQAKIRIIPKAGPYSGGVLSYFDIVLGGAARFFAIQPCRTYGAPGVQYFINSYYPVKTGTERRLTRWALTDPLSPTGLKLTRITIRTDPFSLPPDASQLGCGVPFDTGDTRILNAVFHGGSIWCTLTTGHNWSGTNLASCHWFQLNASNGFLTQQGIFGSSLRHSFFPAVMPDSNGNLVMVFSSSSPLEYGSTRFTGRRSSDPPGKLQGSVVLKAGMASYLKTDASGQNRWGDYNGIAVDPADSLLVWFYGMYAGVHHTWATQIGSARF